MVMLRVSPQRTGSVLPTCRSALRPGWRLSSFWRGIRCTVGDARSPIRHTLISVVGTSLCSVWATAPSPTTHGDRYLKAVFEGVRWRLSQTTGTVGI